ncbi:hypothetical protein [Streptomyces sp. CT34]|nr:hypothetical protein [Streptomyces sp. CT34]
MSGGEISGVDLARVAPRAAMAGGVMVILSRPQSRLHSTMCGSSAVGG